jgi:hypothetical protein
MAEKRKDPPPIKELAAPAEEPSRWGNGMMAVLITSAVLSLLFLLWAFGYGK